jgi:hypothetical protein
MRMPRLRESTWERGDGRWTLVLVRLTLFFFGTRKEFYVLRVVIRVETSSTFEEVEMNCFIVIGTYFTSPSAPGGGTSPALILTAF